MIRFPCPTCNEMLEVADAYAGTAGTCPLCGAAITMPGESAPGMAAEDYRQPRSLRVVLILSGIVALVAVGGIMMYVSFKESPFGNALSEANRTMCKSNLKQLGTALRIYAVSNRGRYPSLYSRSSDPRSAKEVWGGDWDPATFKLRDRDQGRSAGVGTLRPMTSNTHCLWLLVREGHATEDMFICPEDLDAEESLTSVSSDWWDFKSLRSCSYSYQNQLGRTTSGSVAPGVIVAADKCPKRPGAMASAGPVKPAAAEWHLQNSPNHFMDGQNVLYGDGHVEWHDTPNCGHGGDNIWTKGTWDVSTLKWHPVTATRYDRYDEGIEHNRDSWLVP
jgi:prepilin-type processing-associated H-X9-DG protein